MDFLAKILKEIEAQANQERERQQKALEESLAQQAATRRRPAVVAPPPPEPVVEEAPAASPIPAPSPSAAWDRQRILDGIKIAQVLGPPPGLEGW